MTEMKRLLKHERQTRILTELRAGNPIRISELADSLQVSRETVRRDLEELHDSPLIKRTYGGAVADQSALDPAQPPMDSSMTRERQKIAALAMRFVLPHMVVMMDGGSTTLHLARRMAAEMKSITVVTNSAPVAMALATSPTIDVIFCPGRYDPRHGAVADHDTVAFLRRFHVNLAMVSAGGLTRNGPTAATSDRVAVKQAMLQRAEERVLLMDHGKFGRRLDEVICPLGDIDQLVCDAPPAPALSAALHAADIAVEC